MEKSDWLAQTFQKNRTHMRAVAFRMLGNPSEADEAVQETWLRLTETNATCIDNLGGWLTTVVARVCLDMLRSRKSRLKVAHEHQLAVSQTSMPSSDPESDLLLADSVGPALLIILETLAPIERVAFVLHDLFDLSFEEIAPIIDKSTEATRQVASRARRKVRGVEPSAAQSDKSQKEIVSAFLKASRDGNFAALLALMDPQIICRADNLAVQTALRNKTQGAPAFESELKGAQVIAELFKGRAAAAQLALIDGSFGAAWAPAGKAVVAFLFSARHGQIASIDVVMDPEHLKRIDIELVKDVFTG